MPEYIVTWREIHLAEVVVEAENAEEAIRKVRSNDVEDQSAVSASYQNEWTENVEDSYSAEEKVW